MNTRFWVIVGMVLSALMAPSVANAVCNRTGIIVRVTQYDDSYTTTGGYIYFRVSSLSPYYYYVRSDDDDSVSNAIQHMNTGRTVNISGNISSCPAVPAPGGGAYLGVLRYMFNP